MNDKTIELVSTGHDDIAGGLMLYPAHVKDHALFLHCTGVGPDYLFRGGVVAKAYADLTLEIFRLHGYEPIIVDPALATWAHPILRNKPKVSMNGKS